jgi:hypothetical protein
MVTSSTEYDGNEWERKVKHWLRLRYPDGRFEEVPAAHHGDFGIEGFSRDGIAYQCYAPQSALKVAELYENQRIKITNDIKKFIERKDELSRLFGGVVIKSWWLIVPQHRSGKLVQHASAKAKEVMQANLSYVSPDFYIHIATADDFAAEREAAIRIGVEALQLDCEDVHPTHVQEWAGNNDAFTNKLDQKIKAYSGELEDTKLRNLRESWIASFIKAENLLKKLKATAPGVWEQFRGVKQRREDKLYLKYNRASAPSQVLDQTIVELKKELLDKVPNLGGDQAEDIAVGTVSEWLHRCPLNFPS